MSDVDTEFLALVIDRVYVVVDPCDLFDIEQCLELSDEIKTFVVEDRDNWDFVVSPEKVARRFVNLWDEAGNASPPIHLVSSDHERTFNDLAGTVPALEL